MVELSLAHRVKMNRRASVLDEDAIPNRGGALLVVLGSISLFNLFFVCIGAVLAAIIDYDWTEGPASRPPSLYHDRSPAWHRMLLFFFYCTIPLVLSALGVYETIALWRSYGKARPFQMLASASAGLILWIVQFGLEGSCIWASSFTDPASYDYCPFAFTSSNMWPMSYWSTGLALAWVLPFIVIGVMLLYLAYLVFAVLAFRKPSKAAQKQNARMRSYSYKGVFNKSTTQIDRDVPEMSIADAGTSRPPSYRAGSIDLPAEVEKEMV